MALSYAEYEQVDCPNCGQTFEAELWQIIDISERLDLIMRGFDRTLHRIVCEHCQQEIGWANVALLLYGPTQPYPLVFSPAQNSSRDEDTREAGRLLGILAERAGQDWSDELLADGLPVAERSQAVSVMIGESQPTVRMNISVQREQDLDDIALAFMSTGSWEKARLFLDSHPVLLSEEIDETMAALADLQIEAEARDKVEFFWDLLRHCRELGVARGSFEVFYANDPVPEQYASLPRGIAAALRDAVMCKDYFGGTADRQALEVSIRAWEQLFADPDYAKLDNLSRTGILGDAASSYLEHYELDGSPDYLERALALAQGAVDSRLPGDPARAMAQTVLANCLHARFLDKGSQQDLDEAIQVLEDAVTVASPASTPAAATNLSGYLLERAQLYGQERDVAPSIHWARAALENSPPGAPSIPTTYMVLGRGLLAYYKMIGQVDALDEAIYCHRQALQATPADSLQEAMSLNDLGNALRALHERTGDLEVAEEAVDVYRQATSQADPRSADYGRYMTNLGTALRDRYMHTGQEADLDEAVEACRAGLELEASPDQDLPTLFNNLGTMLRTRYARTGQIQDLDQAIGALREVQRRVPQGAFQRDLFLANLGAALRDRYLRSNQPEDLNEAIAVCRQAISESPVDSPDRHRYLNVLAICLRDRHAHTPNQADRDEAIAIFEEVVSHTPGGSPDQGLHLNNLGIALRDRYADTADPADLDRAIQVHQESVDNTPADSPERARHLFNLAAGLHIRADQRRSAQDAQRAVELYEEICRDHQQTSPELALISAQNWGRRALDEQDWSQAARAYRCAVDIAEQLYRAQLLSEHRQSWLRETREIHVCLAYALCREGKEQEAVVVFEQGRARSLGDALARDRASLEQVRELDRQAFEHYQSAANRLRALEQVERRLSATLAEERPRAQMIALGEQIEQARAELSQIIERIRTLPGYANFLAPAIWESIVAEAREAPLVYLATLPVGSLALILWPGRTGRRAAGPAEAAVTVSTQWLDDYKTAQLKEDLWSWYSGYAGWMQDRTQLEPWLGTMNRVLGHLWSGLVGPLAQAISQQGEQQAVLVTGGLLALLPLHAAWEDDQHGRKHALDVCAFRYVPSARALSHGGQVARRQPAPGQLRLVAVADPRPVSNARALPNALAEVAAIRKLFSQAQVLTGEQATRREVQETLAQASVVHFAGHGRNDWQSPLESGLLLAGDRLLTAQDLLDLRLEGARLATLSACETGIPGLELPDEVTGLPSACLLAGFAAVIASLWPVADISTALLMERFYRNWLVDQDDLAGALGNAQRWLRDLTAGELAAHFEGLMNLPQGEMPLPYQAIADYWTLFAGMQASARPFQHPFFWAAFSLYGT